MVRGGAEERRKTIITAKETKNQGLRRRDKREERKREDTGLGEEETRGVEGDDRGEGRTGWR